MQKLFLAFILCFSCMIFQPVCAQTTNDSIKIEITPSGNFISRCFYPEYYADKDKAALQNEARKQLTQAVIDGDRSKIETLLAHYADQINLSRYPLPLTIATIKGSLKIVQLLHEHNARIDSYCLGEDVVHHGRNLGQRTYSGTVTIAGSVTYSGIYEINEEGGVHLSPLTIAITYGDRRIIDFLIAKGALVKEEHLLTAVEKDDIKTLRKLDNAIGIEEDPNTKKLGFYGKVLTKAVECNNLEAVKIVYEYTHSGLQSTLRNQAKDKGNEEIATYLDNHRCNTWDARFVP